MTAKNQTRIYAGDEREHGISPACMPLSAMRMNSVKLDLEIPVRERATTSAEPITSKEEVMEEELKCPKCGKNPSPGIRVDNGQPKQCKQCKSDTMREIIKNRAEPGQNIHENIPDRSSTIDQSDKKARSPERVNLGKGPTALQTLTILQGRIDELVSEIRRLHIGMMVIREVSGLEYEVKMPSLVG